MRRSLHTALMVLSVALVPWEGAIAQGDEPPCPAITPVEEPMAPENYAVESVDGDDIEEFWIQADKTIGTFALDFAGFRFSEGDELRIVGQLVFHELAGVPPERVATLLPVARELAPRIVVFVSYSDTSVTRCRSIRRFVFPLLGPAQDGQ